MQDPASSDPPRWTFEFGEKSITMISQWSESNPPEPVILDFDQSRLPRHVAGFGRRQRRSGFARAIALARPGHFPHHRAGQSPARLPYDARRAVGPFVKVTFPPATKETPRIEYRWEVAAIYPKFDAVENRPAIRRFSPQLAEYPSGQPPAAARWPTIRPATPAPLCSYEYADIALHTPAAGRFAQRAWTWFVRCWTATSPEDRLWHARLRRFDCPSSNPAVIPIFLDTYPSLADRRHRLRRSAATIGLAESNYADLRNWAEALLAMDHDGNGLFEYALSGNSGSWPAVPSAAGNWWDTIGFGHEDAYANALAYRALRGMEKLAGDLDKTDDAARYRAAADKLHAAYVKTFYNPATGVLAGWKSADGQLHDYYFLFVNGIAIHYGLVPKDKANAIMDKLLAKMKEVGYTRFDLGLPGNLIPVARKDYVDLNPPFRRRKKEDNSDGFQIYENGGATGCYAFFTLAALYDLGRREEADRILFPMLDSFEKGQFRGHRPPTA